MDRGEIFFYFTIINGLLLALATFYHAYNVQKNRGFVVESELRSAILILVSVFQLVITAPFSLEGISSWMLASLFIFVFVIMLFIQLYFIGRRYTVYDIKQSTLIGLIRNALDQLQIEYKEKEDLEAEKVKFILPRESAKITISWWGEDARNFTIIFKKWWRIIEFDLLHEYIRNSLWKNRENKVFKKQIILNIIGGVGILLVFSYFAVKMARELFG